MARRKVHLVQVLLRTVLPTPDFSMLTVSNLLGNLGVSLGKVRKDLAASV